MPRLRVRAGATVEFAADADDKRRFILAALAGEVKPPKRKHTRIPVAVPVRFRLPGSAEQLVGQLTEISVGGALLKSTITKPAMGTEIVLEVLPPGGQAAMPVTTPVAYHTPA